MSEPTMNNDTAVAQALGQLTGELRVMHQSLTASIGVIRSDLRRIEDASNERMTQMEDRLTSRIDSMGGRITDLETEDKRLIEKVAKLSTLTGGVGGALAAAAVELIKRM
ncbi:MAG: hypothetical protein Q7U98_09640 [Methylicorpusculum sp.]|uniref:hypothetical protein n=1 Tax=Methylicorpusculum sp. TaxID=2713644 RepID=UPI002722C4F6|nr:hypothetical protein [Methylicorpusculum sp.]MDO8939412.1 hypothetical protein [Methylicorpusculum sp.]